MYKAICGARLLDGSGALPIKDGVLLINGEKIEAVGVRGSVSLPSEAEIIDASGMTVIPGLIDAHIHLDFHGMADTYQENQVEDKLRTLRAAPFEGGGLNRPIGLIHRRRKDLSPTATRFIEMLKEA